MKKLFAFIVVCIFTHNLQGFGERSNYEKNNEKLLEPGSHPGWEAVHEYGKRNRMFAAIAACAGSVAVRQMAGDGHPWAKVGATVVTIPACLLAVRRIVENL